MKNKIDKLALERELGARSLYKFVQLAWNCVEPGKKYTDNWHIKEICRHLEAMFNGDLNRLIINIPPSHMKSLICGVFYPAWAWINKPSFKILYAGYNHDIVKQAHEKSMLLIEDEWFQERWGHVFQPRKETWNKSKLRNDKMGERHSLSLYGAITGKHFDQIIVDDPIGAKDVVGAASDLKTQLTRCAEVYKGQLTTRVTDAKTARFLIIMQRLHEADLAGVLLASRDYEHLCLPANYKEGLYTYNKLGRYDPRELEGDVLWPARFPQEELDRIKKDFDNPIHAAAQLQQTPVPSEGAVFKRENFKYWKELPANCSFIQSWDTTLSSSLASDYVVGQVWAKAGGEFFLVDQIRAKLDFESTKNAIRTMSSKWPKSVTKYIELKASGPDVINSLKKDVPGLVGVKATGAGGNKEQRAIAITGLFEAGNVYFPEPSSCPWVHDLIEELCTFPRSRYDDQVDAMSQALIRLHTKSISSMVDTLRRKLAWK